MKKYRLSWGEEQGLEQLPDNVVSLSINPFFSSSGRLEDVVTSTGYFG
ncbi:hypothetical protein LOB66_03305 [Lactobacillus delbrueckii subsp. lactis]|nr:hypothetical protein [Lactobacillus delbrueckii]MCD5493614.1 hypothetical protein [Lactobacillus delbrueckii subsp. lactis]MCD5508471.1 hypothetical protein [Lactobacillus delbrueckii subsp. lactis]MCD5510288.1 hypothetical protein [Lactobacillus delbrueckii subsp. lactis]